MQNVDQSPSKRPPADRAIIVAAGRGSRMGALTDALPKCLMPFLGVPLIEWQVAALRQTGIPEIVLITGYRAETLASYGDGHRHNPDWASTNMVHTLTMARDLLSAPGATIVAYSDLLYEPRIVSALGATAFAVATAVDLEWERLWRARFDDPLSDAETLIRDPDGRLREIGQKPESVAAIQGQFMGLTRFTQSGGQAFLDAYDDAAQGRAAPLGDRDARNAYFTDVLQRLIDTDVAVGSIETRGGWLEFDNRSDLELYTGWADSGALQDQFDGSWRDVA
ncbi:MAG: phosphocholine cytidylyltransferase family protein [Rhodospirillaceae bacterium]|nr:phosphocholine cytidylyltransferase family protein [Rhodospirillaceae bacterium]